MSFLFNQDKSPLKISPGFKCLSVEFESSEINFGIFESVLL